MMLTSSPSSTLTSVASTATTPPKRRVMPRASSTCRHHAVPGCPAGGSGPAAKERGRRTADGSRPRPGTIRAGRRHDRAKIAPATLPMPPSDHDRQRDQRGLPVEGLVVDVGEQVRRDRAADAADEARDDEGQRLVAVEVDAVGAGGDVVLADRAPGATEVRAEQARLHQREQRDRTERQPVAALDRIELYAEELERRDRDQAHRPLGQPVPVQDQQRDDLADRERRDRDVVPAQPEGRVDQQRRRSPR